MLRGVVNHVPIWLLLLAVVAAIVGLVLLLVWLIRRLVPAVREGFDAEVSSQMLGVVAALFGLLFAFIVVIAYQNYSDTQSNVSDEADALAAIVRDSGAFPQPDVIAFAARSVRTCAPSSTRVAADARRQGQRARMRRPSTACTRRSRGSTRARPGRRRSTTTPCGS